MAVSRPDLLASRSAEPHHEKMVSKLSKHRRDRSASIDLNAPETAAWFERAARIYTETATKTKAIAVQTLHAEGILTKSGRLSKRYSEK